VFLVLGAEFSHSAYCKQNGNLPIILPIVAPFFFSLLGFVVDVCVQEIIARAVYVLKWVYLFFG
jgi:hypothetical protein